MQKSEKKYVLSPKFNANFTEFDSTVHVNNNGEIGGLSNQYDLNINAAAVLNSKGILLNEKGRKSTPPLSVLTKSLEIPTGAVAKMIVNKHG